MVRIISSSFFYHLVPKAEIYIISPCLFFSLLCVRSVKDNLKLPGTGLRLTLSHVNSWDSDVLGYLYQTVGSTHYLRGVGILGVKDLVPSEKTLGKRDCGLAQSEAKVNLSKAWYLSHNLFLCQSPMKSCYFKRVRRTCKLKGQVEKAIFTFGTFLGF